MLLPGGRRAERPEAQGERDSPIDDKVTYYIQALFTVTSYIV